MYAIIKPLLRVWYTVEHWLEQAPKKTARRFETIMFTCWTILFLTALQGMDIPSDQANRMSAIIIILLLIYLVTRWVSNSVPVQDKILRSDVFEIVPEDFKAFGHFISALIGIVVVILSMLFTGEIWLSLIAGLIFAVRLNDLHGPSQEDLGWKISLEDEAVLFHGKGRTARIRLPNVVGMKVYLSYNHPKKLSFKMEDGQLHEVKYYRRMDEILAHCTRVVPESKTEWVSYT